MSREFLETDPIRYSLIKDNLIFSKGFVGTCLRKVAEFQEEELFNIYSVNWKNLRLHLWFSLRKKGYEGKPSDARLRAEYLNEIADTFSVSSYEELRAEHRLGERVFLSEFACGIRTVSQSVIAADLINKRGINHFYSQRESSQGIIPASTRPTVVIDNEMQALTQAWNYAKFLKEDPSGLNTVRASLTDILYSHIQGRKVTNSEYLHQFMTAGAGLGARLFSELQARQYESR